MALFDVVVEVLERRVYQVTSGTEETAREIVESCPNPERDLPNTLDPTFGHWNVIEVKRRNRTYTGGSLCT